MYSKLDSLSMGHHDDAIQASPDALYIGIVPPSDKQRCTRWVTRTWPCYTNAGSASGVGHEL
jgi:hypothetical protein